MSAILLKVALLHGCFSRFLNCTNGTKSLQNSTYCLFFISVFTGNATAVIARDGKKFRSEINSLTAFFILLLFELF